MSENELFWYLVALVTTLVCLMLWANFVIIIYFHQKRQHHQKILDLINETTKQNL